jgi:hypothetical protein
VLLLTSKVRETYSKFPYLRFVVLELNDNVLQWGSTSCFPRLRNLYQLRPKVSASSVSVASLGVCFKCISCVPRCLLKVYQLRPEVSASSVSVASHGVCFKCISCVPKCISCVPRCQLQAYQLRPKVSASSVSVASQGVCFKCISCVPRCQPHA